MHLHKFSFQTIWRSSLHFLLFLHSHAQLFSEYTWWVLQWLCFTLHWHLKYIIFVNNGRTKNAILILVTRFAFYATIFLVQRRLCFFSLFGRIYYRIKWSDSYGQNYMECLTYSNKKNIGDIKGELTCTWRAPRLIRDNIRSSYSHPFLRRSFWHLFEPACIIYCGDKTRCIFLRERNLDKRCSLVVVLISPRYVSVHISPLSSDNSVACVFLRILLTNFCRICS